MADDLAGNLAENKKRNRFAGALRDFGRDVASLKNATLPKAIAEVEAVLGVDDLSAVTPHTISAAFPSAPVGWATRSARYVKMLAAYEVKLGGDISSDKVPPNVSDDVL